MDDKTSNDETTTATARHIMPLPKGEGSWIRANEIAAIERFVGTRALNVYTRGGCMLWLEFDDERAAAAWAEAAQP